MVFRPNSEIKIENVKIGMEFPTYFIADIAANHDGDISRAKDLIFLAAEHGASAAKFQHFTARSIVSDHGFKALGGQHSHQATWGKSVFEVYQDASVDLDWTQNLKQTCEEAGIHFFTSPYSTELVDYIDPFVPAYKIGSGDITWLSIVKHIAQKNKPYFMATGASSMEDVTRAVEIGLEYNSDLVLMQCNTNYTASLENMKYINLNVLRTYREMYPKIILGLSDHTPGHSSVLGAVALGARVIEKHFTDDNSRLGPDHKFSMEPQHWAEMVNRTRELEQALGSVVKRVEENEKDTVVLQRRAIRARGEIKKGSVIQDKDLCVLRPAPAGSLEPYKLDAVLGRKLLVSKADGECIFPKDLK